MHRPIVSLFLLSVAASVFAGDAAMRAVDLGKKLSGIEKFTELSAKPFLTADEETRKEFFKHFDDVQFSYENRVTFCLAVLKNDKNEDVRAGAAKWLAKMNESKAAVAKLGDLLADKSPAVRAAACEGLIGYRGDPTLGPKFAKLLMEESPTTRGAAARALGKLGDRKQVPAILAAYKKFKKDGDEDAAFGEALALLGETDVSLDIAKVALKSRSQPVRASAMVAIECNPSMKAIPIIMENLILELGRTVRLDATKTDWDIVYVTMINELQKRTGKNNGHDAAAWYKWWDGVRETYKAPAPAFDEAIVTRWMETYRKMGPSKLIE